MAETLIKNFIKISKVDTEIAGGKGASLGEMIQANIPVPDGFVILSNAFDRFIEETDLNIEIDTVLDEVNIKEVHTVENVSEKIHAVILSKEIPEDIKTLILKFYKKLDCTLVAVRSSATAEDSVSAAWAGQLDSFLNTTEEALLENVKKCWTSLFTPRAIVYRFEKKLNKDKISVAVVVQKMVESEESGIAFSVHPVTQDENQIIIEAGFGLGEAIVSGSITPDSYVVDKQGFNILDINVNEQTKALYKKDKGGNKWKELGEKGKEQVLAEKEIIELSKLIVKIENHYGFPCDIEWAKEKRKFYIVQSRPITSLQDQVSFNKQKPNTSQLWNTSSDWKYYLARPFSLFGASVWSQWYFSNQIVEILGVNMKDSLFVETHTNFVRNYRIKDQLDEFYKAFSKLSRDKEKIKSLLRIGLNLNEEAFEKLDKKEFKSLNEEVEFLTIVALHATMVPLWIFDSFTDEDKKDVELVELCESLRAESVYPKLIKNIITPIVDQRLRELGIEDVKTSADLITLSELLAGKVEVIEERKEKREQGLFFIYQNRNGSELIEWTREPGQFVAKLEHVEEIDSIIRGNIAFKGKVTGYARLIFTNDYQNKEFNNGDILVASSTSPELTPLIQKSGAVVTDEGGMMCHAAIIARELHKPCIIGTKIATSIINTGDLVEIDANKGTVRILKKANKEEFEK